MRIYYSINDYFDLIYSSDRREMRKIWGSVDTPFDRNCNVLVPSKIISVDEMLLNI